jgi:hypothetical protein
VFLPAVDALARISRRPGPLPSLVAVTSHQLARLVAATDRIVLDGVAEGLALLGVGAGWMVAWVDRRATDGVEYGVGRLVSTCGRWTRELASGRPSRSLLWLGVLALALLLLGRTR